MTSGALDKFASDVAIDQFRSDNYFMQFGTNEGSVDGTNSFSFYKVDAISTSVAGATLTEGTTPTESDFRLTEVNVTYVQLGEYVTISDRMLKASPVDAVEAASRELGGIIAEVADQYIQEQIDAGTNVIYAGDATATDNIDDSDKIDGVDLAKATAKLRGNKAPKFDGGYVAIMHPHVAHDLRMDTAATGFIEASKYSMPEQIFNGEIGKLHDVRVIESANVEIQTDAGASAVDVYYTFVIGRNAYGVVVEEPLSAKVKGLGSGGTTDPLDQRATVGAKITLGAKILKEESLVRIESASSLGANA